MSQEWWFTTWDVENKVWPISQGEGVTVAVIDTGVQASIPELQGVVLPGTNVSKHVTKSPDADGRQDVDTAPVPGHGTGMSTLIAAQGTGTGFVGVAPRAKILPVVSLGEWGLDNGIRWSVDHGAKVINISQGLTGGGACPQNLQDAIGYALAHDVVVVAAAGNSGDTSNPSEIPAFCAGVLAVGGVDYQLNAFVKTERQPYVTVAAPATDVGMVIMDGQFHTSEGGTSSAAALTSAAAALVRSKYPQLSARDVVTRLIASTRDAGKPGKDDQTGYGVVRPYHALVDTPPKNTPNPVFAAYDKWAAAHAKKLKDEKKALAPADTTDFGPLIVSLGVPLVIVIVVLFVVRSRKQRRLQAAGVGQYGQQPVAPQGFGAQYPPQGWGQPPGPGGQPPYYPPVGPQGGQGQPPQQVPYPNPGQQGPWHQPPDRRG